MILQPEESKVLPHPDKGHGLINVRMHAVVDGATEGSGFEKFALGVVGGEGEGDRQRKGNDAARGVGAHVLLHTDFHAREIEFFAQIQQLIWGGRFPQARLSQTLPTLHALTDLSFVTPAVRAASDRFCRRRAPGRPNTIGLRRSRPA